MAVQFIQSNKTEPYDGAIRKMESRVSDIANNAAQEAVWFLEHPSLYTAGTSGKAGDVLSDELPLYYTGRGGQITYHGPGQRIAYVMLDLKKRHAKPDLRLYIRQLEEWIIQTLEMFDIKGERREGRVGIWIPGKREKKIAAIGVRVKSWVTFHGIAINLNPDLKYYEGIVPCGLSDFGVTSLHDLGRRDIQMQDLDEALIDTFDKIFG